MILTYKDTKKFDIRFYAAISAPANCKNFRIFAKKT